MTRRLSAIIASLLMAAPAVMAATSISEKTSLPADSVLNQFDLEEVVVTGTRTAKMLKDTPIQTRLITEKELRLTDANNIQDLLQQELPGIEFTYAMNQQVNMNLGGFSGQGVLILLDGERLAGETMDNTDFSRLNMTNVKRIEIIRGAASALYGSNAAGGVVNIISKDADKPWRLNVNAKASAHNEWRAGASLSNKIGRVANVFDVTFNTIDTYNVCLNPNDNCDYRTIFGSKTWNFRERITYNPIDNLKIFGRAAYYFKERYSNVEAPERYRDFSAGLGIEWHTSDKGYFEAHYSFDQYDKSDFIRFSGLDIRDYSNVQNSLRILYNRTFRTSDVFTFGGDVMNDYLLTYQFGPGETHSQVKADLFSQYDWAIDENWEIIGALRWDYLSDKHDSHVTGKLSASFRIPSLTLRGGYAGGFRAPSLKEKYMNFNMADIFDIHGNPDLKAELSHNFNISAEYVWQNYYFTLGGNYNIVSNRITTSGVTYDANKEPYIRYLNVDRMDVFGLDATVKGSWNHGITASLSYNYTHEQSLASSVTQYCPARPHSLVAKANWNHRWGSNYATDLSISGRFLSAITYTSMHAYEPFDEYEITNPAYTLWRVQLSQHIWRGIDLNLAVDNIFNYIPEVYTFNAPITTGTTFQISLSLNIDELAGK